MDRDFRRKRSRDRREWAAVLGVLLLVLCQLYRVSGKTFFGEDGKMTGSSEGVQREDSVSFVEKIPAEILQAGMGEASQLSLHAKGAVLMDGYTGRVLYEKNASEVMPMASTTKIMTCIVALEYGNPEDMVEISAYAASMPDVKLGIHKGEHYRLGDLLFSLMLESHNDAAVAIAEHIAASQFENGMKTAEAEKASLKEEESKAEAEPERESVKETDAEQIAASASKAAAERTTEESKVLVEAFASLMNQRAEEIGCEHTFFITPNGLDASVIQEDEAGNQKERVHSTTAQELALIMRYCLSQSEKAQEFAVLTQTREAAIADETGSRSFSCVNHNRYLDMKEGALSGKTGFTGKAGYCYVGAVNQNGVYLIVALLACGWPPSKNLKWQDMNTLVNYGLEQYSCVQVNELQEESVDYMLQSYNKNGKTTGVEKIQTEIAFEPFTLLKREGEEISVNWYLDLKAAAPGERVGICQFRIGEQPCKMFPILVTPEI